MADKKIHKKVLNIFSVALLVLILFNIIVSSFYWNDGWTEILWYCDFAAITLSVGILLRNSYMITGVLITAIPAQFFWIVDFVLNMLGFEGLGRTTWLFEWPLVTILPSVIVHLILIPLAIYAVYVYGFSKKGVFAGFILMAIIFPTAYLFSDYEDNINCVFYPCDLKFDQASYGTVSSFIDFFSEEYLLFIFGRWICWLFISYFCLLWLFRRIFKRIKVI